MNQIKKSSGHAFLSLLALLIFLSFLLAIPTYSAPSCDFIFLDKSHDPTLTGSLPVASPPSQSLLTDLVWDKTTVVDPRLLELFDKIQENYGNDPVMTRWIRNEPLLNASTFSRLSEGSNIPGAMVPFLTRNYRTYLTEFLAAFPFLESIIPYVFFMHWDGATRYDLPAEYAPEVHSHSQEIALANYDLPFRVTDDPLLYGIFESVIVTAREFILRGLIPINRRSAENVEPSREHSYRLTLRFLKPVEDKSLFEAIITVPKVGNEANQTHHRQTLSEILPTGTTTERSVSRKLTLIERRLTIEDFGPSNSTALLGIFDNIKGYYSNTPRGQAALPSQ